MREKSGFFDKKTLYPLCYKGRRFCGKNIRAVFLLIFFAVLFFMSLFLDGNFREVARAQNDEEKLSDYVFDGIDNLDLKDFDKFIKGLLGEQQKALDFEAVKDILTRIASGESGDFFGSFLAVLAECLTTYFLSFLPLIISIIIIVILQSVLEGMTSNFKKQSTQEIVHFVCYATIIVMLLAGAYGVVSSTVKTIKNLTDFSAVVFPILLTLLSAAGGVSSAAVYAPLMAAITNIIIQIINFVVIPAFIATIIFSVVGNISKNVKLDKLAKLFKSAAGWVLGIVFGLYVSISTAQGFVASTYDGAGFSAAKFALSSYVPILGGYLSDGFDLVAASVVLIKNSVGLVAIVTLLSLILFPVLKTVVFSLCLKLAGAIVEPLGNERVSGLLHSLSKNTSLLVAAIAGTGFMFLIILLMVIGSCNMAL